jgi:hypothetical protein
MNVNKKKKKMQENPFYEKKIISKINFSTHFLPHSLIYPTHLPTPTPTHVSDEWTKNSPLKDFIAL